jgi:hypothetical protein
MARGSAIRKTVSRIAAWSVVLVAGVGCTPPGGSFAESLTAPRSSVSGVAAAAERCGVPPMSTAGQTRTLVRAAVPNPHYEVVAAAALPDGSVIFAREANAPEPGREVRNREPALLTLDRTGRCRPFDRPEVGGRRVASSALPVAVGPDGQLYLWDPPRRRLVRGIPGSEWRTVATLPASLATYRLFPSVAVAGDGDVYVASDASVWRATPDARLVLVAGAPQSFFGAIEQPASQLGRLPRRAISDAFPPLGAVATTADGRLIVTTGASVLKVDRAGTLRLLAAPGTTQGQDGAIDAGSVLTGVAVTRNGDILLGDTAKRRVLRMHAGRITVLAQGTSSLLSLDPASSRLLVTQAGGKALAVLDLPPR